MPALLKSNDLSSKSRSLKPSFLAKIKKSRLEIAHMMLFLISISRRRLLSLNYKEIAIF